MDEDQLDKEKKDEICQLERENDSETHELGIP